MTPRTSRYDPPWWDGYMADPIDVVFMAAIGWVLVKLAEWWLN